MFDLGVVVKFVALAVSCYSHIRMVGAEESSTNFTIWCWESDNATSYVTSLGSLQRSIDTNETLRDGFYNNTFWNESQEFYGLIQCRGDIPAADCTNCAKYIMARALEDEDCNQTSVVQIWMTACYLLFVEMKLISVVNSAADVVLPGDEQDGPEVASAGLNFMRELASTAAEKPLMFQNETFDLQQRERKSAVAQCIRDLNVSACKRCLNDLVDVVNQSTSANASDWDAYGPRCAMWYRSNQSYYGLSSATNSSQPDNKDGVRASLASTRLSVRGTATRLITAALAFLFALYVHQFE